MPKVRPTVYIIKDAQKHINVGKSRMYRENYPQNLLTKITAISSQIDDLVANMPEDVENDWDRLVSNELNLIKKEQIKEIPKIDRRKAIRAIVNSINIKSAKQAGLDYGMSIEQINVVIAKAPQLAPDTTLGKLMAQAKLTLERQKPKPLPIAPIPAVEQDNTIDNEMDDDMAQALGVGE